MSKLKEKEPVQKWMPTNTDTHELREGLKSFSAKLVNGKKQYPFEQYCASKGIIGFTIHGQIEVINPEKWTRILKAWDLMKWQDSKDMEKLFAAFPEERVKYEKKLDGLREEIRHFLTSKRLSPREDLQNARGRASIVTDR